MMRAIKDRQFEQVLNEYDDMVLAGVKPDTLIMNCLVEAKAQNEGTQQAQETLQVRGTAEAMAVRPPKIRREASLAPATRGTPPAP
jgi:hypothetical protein